MIVAQWIWLGYIWGYYEMSNPNKRPYIDLDMNPRRVRQHTIRPKDAAKVDAFSNTKETTQSPKKPNNALSIPFITGKSFIISNFIKTLSII